MLLATSVARLLGPVQIISVSYALTNFGTVAVSWITILPACSEQQQEA